MSHDAGHQNHDALSSYVSDNHRRIISLTLALLDEKLSEMLEWASGREKKAILYEERNRLSVSQSQGIMREIESVRAILLLLRQNLGLVPRIYDSTVAIRGVCYAVIDPLVELEGKYLRAYGQPSAQLVEYLEPEIKKILVHINEILTINSSGHEK